MRAGWMRAGWSGCAGQGREEGEWATGSMAGHSIGAERGNKASTHLSRVHGGWSRCRAGILSHAVSAGAADHVGRAEHHRPPCLPASCADAARRLSSGMSLHARPATNAGIPGIKIPPLLLSSAVHMHLPAFLSELPASLSPPPSPHPNSCCSGHMPQVPPTVQHGAAAGPCGGGACHARWGCGGSSYHLPGCHVMRQAGRQAGVYLALKGPSHTALLANNPESLQPPRACHAAIMSWHDGTPSVYICLTSGLYGRWLVATV